MARSKRRDSRPQVIVIEQVPQKDVGVAYLLLIFLGLFGAHRFYLGQIGFGLFFLFTGAFCTLGFWLDLFLLAGEVKSINAKLRREAEMRRRAYYDDDEDDEAPALPEPEPEPAPPPTRRRVGPIAAGILAFVIMLSVILIWAALRGR